MSHEAFEHILADHFDSLADLKTKVPPLVLIYPIDQGYLKSLVIHRKWMLKLCCMAPGKEHPLNNDEAREGETRPDLGWYTLKEFGTLSGPILRWVAKHKTGIKLLPKIGEFLAALDSEKIDELVKTASTTTSELMTVENRLPSDLTKKFQTADYLHLIGININEYCRLEGQGLVFLKTVLDKFQHCGSLTPFTYAGQRLWLCSSHLKEMKEQRVADGKILHDELLTRYKARVVQQVSTVRILGDSVPRKLDEVFVELSVTNEREWPSSETQAEYMGLMDAELRRRRNPLSRDYEDGKERPLNGRAVQPDVLLKNHRRAIIVGAPGSGKSTLLRYLAHHALNEKDVLPVFIELKTIQESAFDFAEGSFMDLVFLVGIARVCQSEWERSVMHREFLDRLKKGQVPIFLDGLDEVSGKESFTNLRLLVKDFLQDHDYKNAPLFISTRPYALKDRFSRDEVEEMEIEPFNQEQIERFVDHYYPGEAQPKRLLVELKQRPELRELARVPALLGFLLLLYRKNKTPPEKRSQLYAEVVHELASKWDEEKGVARNFRTTQTRRKDFLSHMAFARLFDGQDETLSRSLVFSSQEILEEADQYCKSKKIADQADLLAEDVKALPLLSQIGTDSYAFAHLTIQEYLAATVLSKHKERGKYFCRAYFDPTLCELEVLPISLALAGHQGDLFNLLTELPESLDFKKLRLQARTLRYGAVPNNVLTYLVDVLKQMIIGEEIEFGYFTAIVKSFRGVSGQAATAIANGVSEELKNEAAIYRTYAVRILGFLENEFATRLLQGVLNDVDGSVRVEAALFVCVNDNDAAIDGLIKELDSDDDEVKEEAIYALWQIGSKRAIEGLRKGSEDKSKFIRRLSLEALSSLEGTSALPILIDHLNDSDDWVRKVVVRELGEISGEDVIDPLIEATADSDENVVEEALKWLGRSGSQKAFDFLLEFIHKHTGKVLGPAVEALGRMKNPSAIPKIYEVLENHKSDDSKKERLSYLIGGWITDYVRVRAAAALVQLGDERGQPVLLDILATGEVGERRYAAYALKEFEPAQITPLLLNRFGESKVEDEQIALANVLLDLNVSDHEPIVNAMSSILNTRKGYRDSRIIGAINVLGQTGGNTAVQALTKALEVADPRSQIATVVALGNIGTETPSAIEALLKRLTGFNVVSEEAARVLAQVNERVLAKGLQLCFQSDWKYVRRKSAQCVAYYTSDERVESALSQLAMNDMAPRVRTVAQQGLAHIKRRRWCME